MNIYDNLSLLPHKEKNFRTWKSSKRRLNKLSNVSFHSRKYIYGVSDMEDMTACSKTATCSSMGVVRNQRGWTCLTCCHWYLWCFLWTERRVWGGRQVHSEQGGAEIRGEAASSHTDTGLIKKAPSHRRRPRVSAYCWSCFPIRIITASRCFTTQRARCCTTVWRFVLRCSFCILEKADISRIQLLTPEQSRCMNITTGEGENVLSWFWD